MQQKLLNIKIRWFDRLDGTVGVKKEILSYDILPNGTVRPNGYCLSYTIKDRKSLSALERLSA